MTYAKRSKLKEVAHGQYKGSIQIPISRYYHLVGTLEIFSQALMSETGNVFSMNYKIRDIFLSLSIIIDHFANDIFKHEKIKQIKNFDCVIKKLAELKLITKKQSKFLNDFRETRNLLTHQKVYSKVYFGGKPLLIRARLRAIIKEVCDIIVRLENKSKLKAKFNYRLIYQLLLDDLKLENNYKKKTSA